MKLIALFLALPLACFTPADFQSYTDEDGLWKIGYPKDWTAQETQMMGAVSFSAPSHGPSSIKNYNVLTQDLSQKPGEDFTLERYVELNIKQMKSSFGQDMKIEQGVDKLAEQPATTLSYRINMQDKKINTFQYMVMKDQVAYVLTFSSSAQHQEAWGELKGQVVERFQILG